MSKDLKVRSCHTFAVDDVEISSHYPRQKSYETVLAARVLTDGGRLEAYSRDTTMLIEENVHNAFIEAAKFAYNHHRPLILSPDAVRLQIAQGFAQHVSQNAETLRPHFVEHQGREKLLVVRNDFIPGFAGNDWESAISEFSKIVRQYIGDDTHNFLVPNFSTTTFVERAAFEVTLLDAMQHYFEYDMMCICGIPEITLEGDIDDWVEIRNRAARFADHGLDWWTEHLLPVLDQFVAARNGDVDREFWQCFYRVDRGCAPDINGHILNLVPYLVSYAGEFEESVTRSTGLTRNSLLGQTTEGLRNQDLYDGVMAESIPPGLARAPFTMQYGVNAPKIPMEFVAGFVGVKQEDTLALRPEIGWAIVEKERMIE